MSATIESLEQELSDVRDSELISRCLKLCHAYGLSASQLSTQWDLLQLNSKVGRMSVENLARLEDKLRDTAHTPAAKRQKGLLEPRTSTETRTPGAPRSTPMGKVYSDDSVHLLQIGGVLGTETPQRGQRPNRTYVSPPIETPSGISPNGTFASRPDAGKVILNVHEHLGFSEPALELERVGLNEEDAVSPGRWQRLWARSHMRERLEERANLLDEQLATFESGVEADMEHAAKAVDSAASEAGAPAAPSTAAAAPAAATAAPAAAAAAPTAAPALASVVSSGAEPLTVVGRVCCDSEGKLNAQSVFLEGSRALSNACRVKLDLSKCDDYALFPGQMVAVTGINAFGHTLVAHSITPGRLPPPRPRAAAAAAPLNVITATGPFTCADDVSYAPLHELLATAAKRRASALVLLGPFVDEQHPLVAAAELSLSFEELLEKHVMRPLYSFLESQLEAVGHAPYVVLVPSLRDATHVPVFPQPPLPLRVPAHLRDRVLLAPNPCTLDLGGVALGCSSLDVLMLLGQQELSSKPKPDAPRQDRMSRLASHVLKQRLFLPVFAAPSDERSPLPVDVVANLKLGALRQRPDIMLLPSELSPFAKVVEGDVLCINSGRLTRKQAGGNYAMFCVHPQQAAAAETDEAEAAKPASAQSVAARTAVQISRI